MRTLLAALGVVAMGSLIASAAEPTVEETTQYQIALRVVKDTNDGKSVLAEPTIVTVEGRPAYFRAGGMVNPPAEAEGATPIEYGTSVLAIIKRHHGQAYIDAQITEAQPDLSDPEAVRISGVTVRVFERVMLDKPIVVPIQQSSGLRCELKVSEFHPVAAKPKLQR